MKKLMYSAAGLLAATHASVANAGLVIDNGDAINLQGGTLTFDQEIARIINLFTQFLTLIAVIYAIW
jgi:hypothetical protein